MSHLYVSIAVFSILIAISSLFVITRSRLKQVVLIVLMLTSTGILTYRALYSFYGRPAVLQVDLKNVTVISFYADKDSKLIYLWLKEKDGEPRAYSIPYDLKTHKKLENAKNKNNNQPFEADIRVEIAHSDVYKNSIKDVQIEIKKLPDFPLKKNQL